MRAAVEMRPVHPDAVLVLSQHVETRLAVDLMGSDGGFGYLLKDRVLDVDEFLDAVERVSRGGSALDPEVVKQRLTPRGTTTRSASSPPGARGARADGRGRTNASIAKELWLTEKTVETHMRSILGKLDLPRTGKRTAASSQS